MREPGADEPAVVIWKGRLLVASQEVPEPRLLRNADFTASATVVPVSAGGAFVIVAFLLEAEDQTAAYAAIAGRAPDSIFLDVMPELGRYDRALRAAVVRAIAIERWSNRYRYCAMCGRSLRWATGAIAKICTNPDPNRVHRHFPRLDPAVIVLVTDGERALLGRSARYPPGFYSTLAGFVEPGESVESALRREVDEEAGIRVGAVRYFGSESWPFPRSLMLGFFAEAQSVDITLRDAELEDARWFDRHELQALQDQMKLARPYFDTIARRLIDTWLAERPGPL